MVGEEEQLVKSAEAEMAKSDVAVAKLQGILDRGDVAALDTFVRQDLYAAIDPTSDAISKLVDLQIKETQSEANQALEDERTSLMISIFIALGGLAALIGSLFIVTRKVVQPIGNLAASINGLAQTAGEGEIPNLEQRDEIGDIARSVGAFRESVIEAQRVRAAEVAAVQETVTTSLASGLSALAAGDLDSKIVITFPPEYEQLKADFNSAVDARAAIVEADRIREAAAAEVSERVTNSLACGLSALASGDLTWTINAEFPPE